MPKGSDWINFIYVNLGFVAQVVAMYYFTAIQDIKSNWPKYRCNPIYMPLSDNIEQDFVYCIQNMQTNYMGYLLQPLTYITSNLSVMGNGFMNSIDGIRTMLSNIRTFATSIIESIFGVFLNIIIEFQKIIIGMKDLIGKQIGILVSMMYIMDGSIKTMQSAWNGPPGQMVRALSGACFLPETNIRLNNGDIKMMKDLDLGDVLENDIKILSIMKLDNPNKKYKLYKFENKGVNGENIYVTGKHMVFSEKHNKFVYVEEHPDAKEQDEIQSSWFSCLITHNNNIKIGDMLFWDWEDDAIAY